MDVTLSKHQYKETTRRGQAIYSYLAQNALLWELYL